MSDSANTQDREYRLKIHRLDAKGKVIDFQDAIEFRRDKNGVLDEGKIIINFTEYDTSTHRATGQYKHYIDVDLARRVFADILNYRFRKDPEKADMFIPLVDEYKGGSGEAAKHPEWEFASRRLIINYNAKLRIGPSVVFNFYLGPGETTQTGAIKPAYRGEAPFSGQITVPVELARKAAATILDYINNKQTAAISYEMIQADLNDMDANMRTLDEKLDKVLEALRPATRSAA